MNIKEAFDRMCETNRHHSAFDCYEGDEAFKNCDVYDFAEISEECVNDLKAGKIVGFFDGEIYHYIRMSTNMDKALR